MSVEPFPSRPAETPEVTHVREALQNLEAAIDAAIAAGAAVLAAGSPARAALNLASAHGMSAERQIAESLVHLTEAKGHALGAHAALTKTARRAGLTVAVGPVDKPEDDPPHGGRPREG